MDEVKESKKSMLTVWLDDADEHNVSDGALGTILSFLFGEKTAIYPKTISR